jgi:hypothetical protein
MEAANKIIDRLLFQLGCVLTGCWDGREFGGE